MKMQALLNVNRDRYGDLEVDFEEAVKTAYPELEIEVHSPGFHGGTADMWFEPGMKLSVPGGEYKNTRHFHTGASSVLAIESTRKRLNLPKCPLFLLKGRMYNGDYKSLAASYYLFGKNEDSSFFLHKVRPCVGQTADLDQVRAWIWNLKSDEKVTARQGDLAFIAKSKKAGTRLDGIEIALGNHVVRADAIWQTTNKVFAINPIANHGEHHTVQLEGLFELRLGRAWRSSAD
jgi:hypothetical protein